MRSARRWRGRRLRSEEPLEQREPALDDEAAGLRRERARVAEMALRERRLVAAVRVLLGRRQVADEVVRIAERERGRRGRARLQLEAELGEGLARPADDPDVADPERLHRRAAGALDRVDTLLDAPGPLGVDPE